MWFGNVVKEKCNHYILPVLFISFFIFKNVIIFMIVNYIKTAQT